MKTTLSITGMLAILLIGVVMLSIAPMSQAAVNIIGCAMGILVVSFISIQYRKQSLKDAHMRRHGLNHYRHHVHHRRVIKKTS